MWGNKLQACTEEENLPGRTDIVIERPQGHPLPSSAGKAMVDLAIFACWPPSSPAPRLSATRGYWYHVFTSWGEG